jgi:mannose/fructose/sorbose-specific phosphotransferase system IIA component
MSTPAMETPRIGVLVICHGGLGQALLDTVAMLVGPPAKAWAVGLMPGEGVEDLETKVRAALGRLDPDDGALCLVDIPGGVPARVAGALTVGTGRAVETVSGVNLPMLAEALLRRDDADLSALAELAARAGRDGVVDLGAALRAAAARASARSAHS